MNQQHHEKRSTSNFSDNSRSCGSSSPGEMDIICGRGKVVSEHPGNKRLRTLISEQLAAYQSSQEKIAKSAIVSTIIRKVRESGGTFLKENPHNGLFEPVSERFLREKVGQKFRDTLHTIHKSNSPVKKRRQYLERIEQQRCIANYLQESAPLASLVSSLNQHAYKDIPDQKLLHILNKTNIKIIEQLNKEKAALSIFKSFEERGESV